MFNRRRPTGRILVRHEPFAQIYNPLSSPSGVSRPRPITTALNHPDFALF